MPPNGTAREPQAKAPRAAVLLGEFGVLDTGVNAVANEDTTKWSAADADWLARLSAYARSSLGGPRASWLFWAWNGERRRGRGVGGRGSAAHQPRPWTRAQRRALLKPCDAHQQTHPRTPQPGRPANSQDTRGIVGPQTTWREVQWTKVRALVRFWGLRPWFCAALPPGDAAAYGCGAGGAPVY